MSFDRWRKLSFAALSSPASAGPDTPQCGGSAGHQPPQTALSTEHYGQLAGWYQRHWLPYSGNVWAGRHLAGVGVLLFVTGVAITMIAPPQILPGHQSPPTPDPATPGDQAAETPTRDPTPTPAATASTPPSHDPAYDDEADREDDEDDEDEGEDDGDDSDSDEADDAGGGPPENIPPDGAGRGDD